MIYFIVSVALVSIAPTASGSSGCASQIQPKGCFSINKVRIESELLINDRDGSSGHSIQWNNFTAYLDGLACRCFKAAHAKGYTMFGLEFWGECWAYRDYEKNVLNSAPGKCYDTEFKDCKTAAGNKSCVGAENMVFVYKNLIPSFNPSKDCASATYLFGSYYLNASLPFAPGSKFCRVVISTANDDHQGNYVIRAHMYNWKNKNGLEFGSGGLLFNVQDINNFQFVYIRFNKEFPCYEYGVVRDGKIDLWNFSEGHCSHIMWKTADWVTVMIHMNYEGAWFVVNGHYLALLPSVLPKRARGGIVTRNGEGNNIIFEKYFTTKYNLKDIIAAGNKG